MDYLVSLERFYGPLDLLLYLLEKHQIDIYDIPIALITDQYMEHLAASRERDLDHIGEFLAMASYLLNLKSSTLLPHHRGEGEVEEEDNRLSLVRQLLEYRRFKQAARDLEQMVQDEGHHVFFRPAGHWEEFRQETISGNLQSLHRVYEQLLQGLEADEIYAIPQDDICIEETMSAIGTFLNRRGKIAVKELFCLARTRRELTVMFLALLELVRRGTLWANQVSEDDEIEIEWLDGGVEDYADAQ